VNLPKTTIPYTGVIPKDWFGKATMQPPAFSLTTNGTTDSLEFTVRVPRAAACDRTAQGGAFQPELWRYDVGELFIFHGKSSRYLEFNLSPTGAWWMAFFESYRKQDGKVPVSSYHTSCTARGARGSQSWEATLKIPHAIIEMLGKREDLIWNVTFILNSPDYEFYTYNHLSDGEPDFHLRPEKNME
jgi:hypothetical protein